MSRMKLEGRTASLSGADTVKLGNSEAIHPVYPAAPSGKKLLIRRMNLDELKTSGSQASTLQLAGAIGDRIAHNFNATQGHGFEIVELNGNPFTGMFAAFSDGQLVGYTALKGRHLLMSLKLLQLFRQGLDATTTVKVG